MDAVNQNGQALNFASGICKGDKDIVKQAIRFDAEVFMAASYSLRNDPNFVSDLIALYWPIAWYISEELINNHQFMMDMVNIDFLVLGC